ncbi:MAG: pallilysin-related adhesin [Spirochaetaceae bacterium]
MKLYPISVFATMAVLVLGGCAEEREPPPRVETNQVVVPEAADGIRLASRSQPSLSIRDREVSTDVKVRMSEDAVISQAIDINLDVDQADEQIIVFKRRDDPEDRIHVLVADFDGVRNSYVPAWEGTTQASNVRTFALYTKDLTGDHDMEIVAVGMDNEGHQTIDVFKRTSAFGGFGLRYERIASLTTDASIEIEETERSDAYQSVQTGGRSFPIVVYRRDPESENVLDLVKHTYVWRESEDSYVEAGTDSVPGSRIEEEQLSELYDGDAAGFEDFLAGPWYRAESEDATEPAGEIIFFDPSEDRITFHGGETLESYIWLDSQKTIYRSGPGVWVNVRNESLENIRRQVSISVETIDRISLRMEDAESWNGTYRKLTPGLRDTLLASASDSARSTDAELQGLYSNDSGMEIFFAEPRFTMRTEDEKLEGGFAAYRLDRNVLRLKVVDSNGLVVENRTYAFSYSENEADDRIVRRLELTPARVRVDGVELTSNDTISLEQTEELDDSDDADGA